MQLPSAWVMYQLLPCLKSHEEIDEVAVVYLATLLVLHMAEGCFEMDVGAMTSQDTSMRKVTWDDIIVRTLKPPIQDPHLYKVVQVCYNMSQETEDSNMIYMYKRAATMALDSIVEKAMTKVECLR